MNARCSNRRRGVSLIYTWVMLLGLLAVASLVLDWGRVLLVKYELQTGADAAARAAAGRLRDGVAAAQSAAVSVAQANTAGGQPIVLADLADQTDGDFVIGRWDPEASPKFTPLTGSARSSGNAVKITARRTAARGTGVSTLLSQVFGYNPVSVTATAVASVTSGAGSFDVVGLDQITMSGTPDIVSASGQLGTVATNGNMVMSGNPAVAGNVAVGGSVSNPSKVSGTIQQLTTELTYPPLPEGSPSLSWVQANNNNASLPSGWSGSPSEPTLSFNQSKTIQPGIYYLNSVSLGGNANLVITGDATFYITGSISMGGGSRTSGSGRLTVILVNPGSAVSLSGHSELNATVYAPQSDISMSGNSVITGSVVGRRISMSGTPMIRYNSGSGSGGGGGTRITLEQ